MNSPKPKLLLVTGLPASGKTTLARSLAQRYRVPLIAKDAIKEPLFDVLGAPDAAQSRALSDASFAVMFSLTRELLDAGVSVVLEGNFRAGEHEQPLGKLALSAAASEPLAREVSAPMAQGTGRTDEHTPIAQILCRVDEQERLRRLAARAHDFSRHPGHRDITLIGASVPHSEGFLSLEGERLLYESERTLIALDAWWSR